MTTATWITIALLTPFWWGLGLLILAWLTLFTQLVNGGTHAGVPSTSHSK